MSNAKPNTALGFKKLENITYEVKMERRSIPMDELLLSQMVAYIFVTIVGLFPIISLKTSTVTYCYFNNSEHSCLHNRYCFSRSRPLVVDVVELLVVVSNVIN